MLYQDYKKKVNKFVQVLKFIGKYKIAIISALATIIMLVTSFAISKGMIYGEKLKLTEIEYGSKPVLDAEAIFSDVVYEFARKDSENWSTTVPTKLGEYKMRVTSSGLFGTRYSDEQRFSIVPKNITVSTVENAIIYGENPSVSAELAFSDTVSCSGFIYEDSTLSSTKVTPDKSKVIVTDKKGRDVTANYAITVMAKQITFAKRDIIITAGSDERIYDGKPFEFPFASALDGGLAFDDNVVTMVYPEGEEPLVNVGSKVNNGIIFIMRGSVDVTHQYNITVIPGTLKLNVRPLIVEIGSKDFEYDGKAHSFTEFTYDSEATPLPEGHTLMQNPLSTAPTVTNVNEGMVNNILDLRVYNKDGGDVTSNFAITILPEDGAKIWITKRKIYVKTQDASFVYNGAEQSAEGYTVVDENGVATENGLIDGHTLVAVEKTTVKNVVTGVENVVEYKVIDTKNNNEDVTDNYEIEYIYGTIDVKKKTVLFLSDSSTEETYDGKEHKAEGFTCPDEDKQICAGHTVEITYNASVTDCETDPESKGVENTFIVVIKDENGDDGVMENYEIIQENGWLKLNPRPITIVTATDNKTYDGTALKKEDFTYADGSLKIVEGQIVKYIDATELVNVILNEDMTVGTCDNIFEIEIYQGEEEKTFNYVITYEYGTLRVDKRPITVTSLGFADKVYYDGNKHRNDGVGAYVISPGDGLDFALVDGHIETVIFEEDSYVMLADPAGNNRENKFRIDISDGTADVKYNYDITTVFGTLTLEKRPVQFASGTLSADEAKYDGLPHSKEGCSVAPLGEANMGLVAGHTPVDSGYSFIVNVKDSGMDNIFTVTEILDAESNPVTLNYDITGYLYGTLSISPREITLESSSGEKLYDGTALKVEGLVIGGDGEAVGQTLVGQNYKEITDVQVDENGNAIAVDNTFTYTVSDDVTGGEIDSANYVVTDYIYGKLKLNKRKITITSQDASKIYDDTPLYNDELLVSGADGLADGQTVLCTDYISITDVSLDSEGNVVGVTNLFTYAIIWTENGSPVSKNNYEVTELATGILTVYKRELTITVDSHTKEYDGTPLVGNTYTYNTPDEMNPHVGLLPTHTIEYDLYAVLTAAGTKTYGNGFDLEIYRNYDVGVTSKKTRNYDITIIEGTLSVTKRPISLDLREQEKQYDGEYLYPEFDNSDVSYFENSALAGIVAGDTITLNFDGISIVRPGTVEVKYGTNVLSYLVTNSDGEDVSGCYEIMEASDGSLTITKRKLTITVSGNYKEYYDGAPIGNTGAVVDNLLESRHTISYTIRGSQTDVGSSFATVAEGSVVIRQLYNNAKIDIDKFYDFAYDDEHIIPGELTVEKQRNITIKTPSGAFPYDGLAHNSDVEVKANCEIIDHVALLGFPMQRAEDFDIRFSNVEMKNPGTYENNIVIPVEVCVSGTDVRTTDNYVITVEKGTVTIGKIEITKLITGSDSKEYDGTPLTNSYVYWESKEPVPSSIEVIITPIGTITDAGSVENDYVISVKIDGRELSESEKNDLLTVEPEGVEKGVLTVNPISITVTSADIDKWYYGEAPDYKTNPDTVWKYFSDWVDKENFELNITPKPSIVQKVGKHDNEFTASLTYNGYPVSSQNCSINCVYGEISIYVRSITVYTQRNTSVYDGIGRTFESIRDVVGLPDGQRVVPTNFKTFLDATSGSLNTCDVKVVDEFADDVDTTKYYDNIIVEAGIIVINPRPITIAAPNHIQAYTDGSVVRANNEIYDVNGDLVALNRGAYNVSFDYIIDVDMGSLYYTDIVGQKYYYSIPAEAFHIVRTEDGLSQVFDAEKMAQNFVVTFEQGYLLLTNNLVKIMTKGHTFVYDGTWKYYVNSDFGIRSSQLPAGHTCVIDVEGIVNGEAVDMEYIGTKNAGEVDLDRMLEYLIDTGRLKMLDQNGYDVTDEFYFAFVDYKGNDATPLTVEKRHLKITAGSKTEYYQQGNILKCDENDYKVTGTLITGDELLCKIRGSLAVVGTARTYIGTLVIIDANKEDVTTNYEIEEETGLLIFVENNQG